MTISKEPRVEFVPTLKRLMEERNIQPPQLCRAIKGLKRSTLEDWLTDPTLVPRDLPTVKKIADYFGVTFPYMIFGHDDTPLREKIEAAPKSVVLDGVYQIIAKRIDIDGQA